MSAVILLFRQALRLCRGQALATCQLSPVRKPAGVASLATNAFSGHCQGPALLVSFTTCQLALYRQGSRCQVAPASG